MAAAATGAAVVFPSRLSKPQELSISVPHLRRTVLLKPSVIKFVVPHSSSSSSPDIDTLSAESESPSSSADDLSPAANGGCKVCGREEVERGCNGEGRIQGGIATVPGFGWWPIKAYRPCPGFLASGGRYSRQGQTMDDVVSGTGRARPGDKPASSSPPPPTVQAYSSSKKKNGQNRSKKRSPAS